MGAPFYVSLEDMWNKLVRKDATGLQRQIIDVLFWIAKFFAFSYLGISFLLASFSNIWKYYSSVYHIGYVAWCVFMVLGKYLLNLKKSVEKLQQQQKEFKENEKKQMKKAA